MIFTGYWKILVLNLSGVGNTVFFEPKSWWKYDIYWLLKNSCFELFGVGNTFFLRQKVNGKMINISLLRSSCFGLPKSSCFSGMGNRSFSSQSFDVKIIFTWSFWAFHYIPGPGKYGFLCSNVSLQRLALIKNDSFDQICLYSKNICSNISVSISIWISFRICSTTKLSKYSHYHHSHIKLSNEFLLISVEYHRD